MWEAVSLPVCTGDCSGCFRFLSRLRMWWSGWCAGGKNRQSALSGQKIYSKATFTEAENEYKLPQAALDVADILAGAGVSWKVRSVVPNELLCYIRQYRCDIGLFYGRNVGGFISGIGDDEVAMYQQMCQEKPDMTVVTDIAKRNQVVFLCFNRTEQEIPDDMKPYGYHYYSETGDYVIYMLGEE